tara:strand:- start:24305 stop:25480 length:1176 start_codon:yes stop_codon:yes gene_type:complete
MMKKQIVFIEAKPTIYTFKIARALRLTGNYETHLFSFSGVDKDFFGDAFDKIEVLEWSHKINFTNFIDFFRKLFGRDGRKFFNKIKNMNPYVFQITGPDLFTCMTMFFLRRNKQPKIYFAYDIWGLDKRNFLFTKKPGARGSFQKIFEKFCFKMADGVLHKGMPGELELLDYKVNLPDLQFILFLLDEWTIPPVKVGKNEKNLKIVYGGGPLSVWEGRIPFIDVTKIITNQKIPFYTTALSVDVEDDKLFLKEDGKNPFFYFNVKSKSPQKHKKLVGYHYGILPDFYDPNLFDISTRKHEMAGKMIKYLEAGIPVIMNKQLEYMANLVEEHNIGVNIDFEELKNLKEIISKINYVQLQKNVKKFQEKYKLSKQIKKLEDFYGVVVKSVSKN